MTKNNHDIADRVKELIRKNKNKHSSKNSNKLLEADEMYNDMISKGLIKKRGFTLRGIEDTHLLRRKINS